MLISAEEKRTVLVMGTLDTKSQEIRYLRDRILESGLNVIVLDNGVLGEPQGIVPDIPARETAKAAGTTLDEVRKAPSRGAAIEEMIKGCKVLVQRLYDEGRIHAAISFGGAEGGVMAGTSMQVLPPGFPKIVITPLASGVRPFGPFVGIRDIMVMHSLIDIVGINDISRSVFDNASAAIIGMAKNYRPMEIRGRKNVALTALGTVQKAINFICPQLIRAGYQPIIFHASGVGGRIMEDFIERRTFCGVIDLSPNEVVDHIIGAFHDAGPNRLEAAGKLGIPQIFIPGCVDFFAVGPADTVPEKWRDRQKYYHNPAYTLIRPSHAEMKTVAEAYARKLNAAKGPVIVILPLRGMSIGGLKGGSTHDPEGDRIFFETLKKGLRKDIPVYEMDNHVNEEPLADK
ncbi:MAG TPA: Tm-1-like ATP-binding domain-containing protein, partial [Thermodesulfobacteriota bacterium]|nr:Tm-1-like ATP-binding domain-containing protein [Thermodesulfobacteriota bacterium]